ncbi:uncharacterized protein LOC141648980 [Silene latifolia]|uniref:uncharacterized protein LOC141648980 n=1 Tax=Silene latifolia TaxID=37657 RepID=UPI003D76D212
MRIVSKCIANRLKNLMPQLVGAYQNGFIPGRSITDNILISHELFHYISKKTSGKKGVMAFKVDMSKAYDRLRWNFIEATLHHMGFPQNIIRLIMNCISTVSYEVIINGTPGTTFMPKAGIRQGDPLSPYLFALCTEVLSQSMLRAQEFGRLQGVQICRTSPSISHLLFADDSIFFTHATTQNCQELRNILDQYCYHSGQQINNAKSAVSFSPNCTMRTTADCLKILNISSGTMMGSYLGLPTEFGTSKKEVFALLLDKVNRRIHSWNNVFLSAAGRLTLIYSILSSLSIYSLSAFRVPVSVTSKIDSLISQFWWGGCKMGKGIHWSSRLFLHSSKINGGLGIRHTGCLNQSLLAKLGWKILIDPQCLLSQVVGNKYRITPESVMCSNSSLTGSLSWGGRGIKWGIELLKENISWQVGFPSSLDIWRDKWIHTASLAQLLSLSVTDIQDKPHLPVALLQSPSGEWNQTAVLNVCGPEVMPLVLSTPIPLVDESDCISWNLTKTGQYSSKSGYTLAFAKLWTTQATIKDKFRMDQSSMVFCHKELWYLPIHNKWKIFLWKIMSNSLPCGEEARKRELPWDYCCVLCSSEPATIESLIHLFRDCPFTSRFWAASPMGIRSQEISEDFYGLFGLISADAQSNVCVQNDMRRPTSDTVLLNVEDGEDSFLLRNHFPLCMIGPKICSNHIRIKCDASWKTNLRATAGWLLQDVHGFMFHCGSVGFWAKSALQAEAMALKYACMDALARGYRHIDATSDCLNLVLQLNGCGEINHDAAPVLRFIVSLISSCHCFSLSHCPRSLNRIAHTIATSVV